MPARWPFMPLRCAAIHLVTLAQISVGKSPIYQIWIQLPHWGRAVPELLPSFCTSLSGWAPKPKGAEGPGGAQPALAGQVFGHPNLTCCPGELLLMMLILVGSHVLFSYCCQGLCLFTLTVKKEFLIRFLLHLYVYSISQVMWFPAHLWFVLAL